MATYKQINYIKTMLSKASRKTRQEAEDVLFDSETPNNVIDFWIKRLEKETGAKEETP